VTAAYVEVACFLGFAVARLWLESLLQLVPLVHAAAEVLSTCLSNLPVKAPPSVFLSLTMQSGTDSPMSVELMDQRWDVEISRDTVFGGKYVACMDGEDRPEFCDLHEELVMAIRTNGNGACAIHAAFGSWWPERAEWYSRSSDVETSSLRGSIPTFLSVVRVSISPGLRRAVPQESPQDSPGAVLL